MADDRRAVRFKLEDRGLFFCLLSLGFLFSLIPSLSPGASKYCDADNTRQQLVDGSVDRVLHW